MTTSPTWQHQYAAEARIRNDAACNCKRCAEHEALSKVLTLAERVKSWPRPLPGALPRPMPPQSPSGTIFTPMTDEIKAQQEQDRIKFDLPF